MRIREAEPADAEALAVLPAALGSPDAPGRAAARAERFAADPSSCLRHALVEAMEAFARSRGCSLLEVTSGERSERDAAHRFYAALGYERVSRRFLKAL